MDLSDRFTMRVGSVDAQISPRRVLTVTPSSRLLFSMAPTFTEVSK